jgi:hypothetical protein
MALAGFPLANQIFTVIVVTTAQLLTLLEIWFLKAIIRKQTLFDKASSDSKIWPLYYIPQQKFIQFSLGDWICITLGSQNLRIIFLSIIFSKVVIEKSVKKT